MELADPRNIDLSLGFETGVRYADLAYRLFTYENNRFRGRDIRTGPTMFPDLAVIVMDGAINPRLPNIRHELLAIQIE